jgi:hypothetical protein
MLTDETSRKAVELAEQHADGLATGEELSDPWPRHLPSPTPPNPAGRSIAKAAASAADAARLSAARDTRTMGMEFFTPQVARYAAWAVAWKVVGYAKDAAHAEGWAVAWDRIAAGEYEEQARLLRDILGNPFRRAALNPSWLTPDVMTGAGHIYQDRAFGRLPVLADALLDAGCQDEALIQHCREPGPHARGCWAVDLILGKS